MQLFGSSGNPWSDHEASGSHLPTMLTEEELRMLNWAGETRVIPGTRALEIGPWLGASTYALAAGMRKGGQANIQLQSVDSFVWHPFMSERTAHSLEPGQSFESLFNDNLAELDDLIQPICARLPDDLIQGDPLYDSIRDSLPDTIPVFTWESGPDLSLLFVDGAKSWRAYRHLLQQVSSSFMPDQTTIILQDYKYWGCYWIPAITELLGETITLEHVARANSTVFRVVHGVPSAAASIPEFQDTDVEQVVGAIETASRRLRVGGDPHGAAIVSLSRVPFLWHRGQPDRAVALFEATERSWPMAAGRGNLERARQWMKIVTGVEHPPSWRTLLGRSATLSRDLLHRARAILQLYRR